LKGDITPTPPARADGGYSHDGVSAGQTKRSTVPKRARTNPEASSALRKNPLDEARNQDHEQNPTSHGNSSDSASANRSPRSMMPTAS